METLGFECNHFSSYWSSFGNLKIFDINRQMYNYGPIEKQMKRLEYLYTERVNPRDSLLDPDEVKNWFRFLPHRNIEICDLLEPHLKHKTRRNNPLSVLTQVCTTLLYYGPGKLFNFAAFALAHPSIYPNIKCRILYSCQNFTICIFMWIYSFRLILLVCSWQQTSQCISNKCLQMHTEGDKCDN